VKHVENTISLVVLDNPYLSNNSVSQHHSAWNPRRHVLESCWLFVNLYGKPKAQRLGEL